MADINVERKRPSLLPWLVGVVLLMVMVWGAAQVVEGRDLSRASIEAAD